MLKVRLQGTIKEIRWFKRLLEQQKKVNVIQVSEEKELTRLHTRLII